jgi:hypothetical protein
MAVAVERTTSLQVSVRVVHLEQQAGLVQLHPTLEALK